MTELDNVEEWESVVTLFKSFLHEVEKIEINPGEYSLNQAGVLEVVSYKTGSYKAYAPGVWKTVEVRRRSN